MPPLIVYPIFGGKIKWGLAAGKINVQAGKDKRRETDRKTARETPAPLPQRPKKDTRKRPNHRRPAYPDILKLPYLLPCPAAAMGISPSSSRLKYPKAPHLMSIPFKTAAMAVPPAVLTRKGST